MIASQVYDCEKPLISIITSTFNAETHFGGLIDSIRSQQNAEIEWIVVDGGSTDQTVTLAKNAHDVVNVLIVEPDRGIYDAWNKGIAAARGTWIAFVGADDYYLPNGLELSLRATKSVSNDVNLIVASVDRVNEENTRILRSVASPWDWEKMKKWMVIGHPGTLHHRILFDRFGKFDTTLQSASDYDFLLRAGDQIRASFIETPLVRVRAGGVSQQVLALKEAQFVRRRNLGITAVQAGISYLVARAKMFVRNNMEWCLNKLR